MAKDARIPVRLPTALKEELEWAAEQDGCKGVSTWLRQLGEERAEWLRERERLGGAGPLPRSEAAKTATRVLAEEAARQRREGGPFDDTSVLRHELVGPEELVFIPGLGLEEE